MALFERHGCQAYTFDKSRSETILIICLCVVNGVSPWLRTKPKSFWNLISSMLWPKTTFVLRAEAHLPGQQARSGPGYSSQKNLIPDIQSLCQYLSPLFPNLSSTVFHLRNMILRDSCQFRKLFLSYAFLYTWSGQTPGFLNLAKIKLKTSSASIIEKDCALAHGLHGCKISTTHWDTILFAKQAFSCLWTF